MQKTVYKNIFIYIKNFLEVTIVKRSISYLNKAVFLCLFYPHIYGIKKDKNRKKYDR